MQAEPKSRRRIQKHIRLPNFRKVNRKVARIAWSYDMAVHAQKSVERYCELAKQKKNIDHLCEVSTPCIDDHQFKQEELETVRE